MKPVLTLLTLVLVIGLEVTSVEIRDGKLIVDGKMPAEPYLKASDGRTRRDMHVVSVPANSYFVMGDNRDVSEDSRDYGFIARNRIIGKQWF